MTLAFSRFFLGTIFNNFHKNYCATLLLLWSIAYPKGTFSPRVSIVSTLHFLFVILPMPVSKSPLFCILGLAFLYISPGTGRGGGGDTHSPHYNACHRHSPSASHANNVVAPKRYTDWFPPDRVSYSQGSRPHRLLLLICHRPCVRPCCVSRHIRYG